MLTKCAGTGPNPVEGTSFSSNDFPGNHFYGYSIKFPIKNEHLIRIACTILILEKMQIGIAEISLF